MFNIAVIGVGSMGRNHVRVLSTIKGVKLAVCDENQTTGETIAKNFNVKYYKDYKKLLSKERLNAVVIATPTKLHKKIATYFIKHNIPLLIEKPLAENSKDAKFIVKLAAKHKVLITVGHVERFNSAVIELKHLIDKGYFGDILGIIVRRVGLFPPRVKDVNVISDLAVHDLDIIVNLIGNNPKSIFACGSGGLTKGREDHAEIFLDYEKFGCLIQVNWVTPIKIRNLSITGTKGYADLNYITQTINLYKSKYKLKKAYGFDEFVAEFGEPKLSELDLSGNEPLKLELHNFIKSVKNNVKPKVSPDEGLRAILLSEAAIKSVRGGKIIKIKSKPKTNV